MKYLRRFNENLDVNPSINEIVDICRKYRIENWTLNPETGLVDVDGYVNIGSYLLKEIPLKFGKVKGDFFCYNNELNSLEGCPHTVGGDFFCYGNRLTSLEGAPINVGGHFFCYRNELTSLEGCPKSVGSYFDCSNNKLVSLKGLPNDIRKYITFRNNDIIDFEYFPTEIDDFNLDNNPVEELWTLFENKDDIELFNDFDPVRLIDGQPTVILDRLNSFLEMIGKPTVTTLKKYKVI